MPKVHDAAAATTSGPTLGPQLPPPKAGQIRPSDTVQEPGGPRQRRAPRKFVTGYMPQRLSIARQSVASISTDDPTLVDMSMTTPEAIEASAGMLYLMCTLAVSLYYLHMLSPVLANDLWWARFNASGAQSYLIDVYNKQLNLVTNGTVDFTSPATGIAKDYSTYYTPIAFTPTYSRMVVAANTRDLGGVITSLRSFTGPEAVDTQYCWLDFNRTWEVAHTAIRQQRCQSRYIQNAAMYWETTARLVNWKNFMTKREGEWNVTVANALRKTPEGQAWLVRTPNAYKDLVSELALWKEAGLTHFPLQYTNQIHWAVSETITIENAFGGHEGISIKGVARKSRDWTLWVYQWAPGNDIYIAANYGYSMIRSDSDHQQFTYPCSYTDYVASPASYACDPCNAPWNPVPGDCWPDWDIMTRLPDVPLVQMVRQHIGPFGSIDAFFVPAPASLQRLYAEFNGLVATLAQTNSAFNQAFMAIPPSRADPVPPTWSHPSYMYLGGDPTCTGRQPMPYVQSSMAFDIACTDQSRHTMALHKFNALFGMWASKASPTAVCSLCPTLAAACASVAIPATSALAIFGQADGSLDTLTAQVKDTIEKLSVGILQFAVNTSDETNAFLHQPMLDSTAWDAFGWIYLFEWASGAREVVSIEGDNGVFPLISNVYVPYVNEARDLEVPRRACQFLWVISVAVTTALVAVGAILTAYSILLKGRIVGRNLFRFNRIVGAVWLGRPLLLVRGMTAVVLLSTSPLDFGVFHGFTRFEFAPRTFLESMIVSGEAMWISYVINDFLLLFTRNSQPLFAPISTGIGWLIYLVMDVASPYKIEATLNQQCSIDYRLCSVKCLSGEVNVGNPTHAINLVIVQVASTAVAMVGVKLWQCVRPTEATAPYTGHLLLSGTATAFLDKQKNAKGALMVDRASCVMCGLLTFGSYFFDTKLWLLVVDPYANTAVKWHKKLFKAPELNGAVRDADNGRGGGPTAGHVDRAAPFRGTLLARLGLVYVFTTIFGSVTYLSLTSTNMANDFWWANYNSSREHVHLARTYNQQLNYRPHAGEFSLESTKFVDDADYNKSLAKGVVVTMIPFYSSQVQSTDGTKIAMVVRGLRRMDACLAPWISTQYCWVDFQKTWEMANSVRRQARCAQNYTTNGAVYLESVLRNVEWSRLRSCWDTSLNVGFAKPLGQTDKGAQWWSAVQTVQTTESDEVQYWQSFGVTSFTTNWQNYKSIGIIDTFNIQNAFGISYPMTLKYSNGSFTFPTQTSLKMYWSFASDLWAVTDSTNYMAGASLIRDTPEFAFASHSMEDVLVQNKTVMPSDLATGTLAAFRQTIGPLGSVDLKRIPPPASLVTFVLTVKDALSELRAESAAAMTAHANLKGNIQFPYSPETWRTLYPGYKFVGGNIFCNRVGQKSIDGGMFIFSGGITSCTTSLTETLVPNTMARLIAVLGAGVTRTNVMANQSAAICRHIRDPTAKACPTVLLKQPASFLRNASFFPDPGQVSRWEDLAVAAQADVHAINVEIMQYGSSTAQTPPTTTIMRHELFDPTDPSFHYYSWMMAYDWTLNNREVIAMHGDVGTINVMTAATYDTTSLVNPLEVPLNVAYYMRYACIYVTCVIICVAGVAMAYLVLNRGHVEGVNLFELNRVAGIVWVGRTFLFIRSMAAMSLLSTQVLSLEATNSMWHFVGPSGVVAETPLDHGIRIFKTILAAGEVSWLVYVLNDVLVVVTQQYTTGYVIKCNVIVWGVSVVLSLASPATHTATIDRQCEYAQVDFQLVCSNGTVAIGSYVRFGTLIGICVASILVCYAYERIKNPHLPPPPQTSLFLASSAKFVFDPERWVSHEVYYMDPASAAINGILSLRARNTFYVFDLKIWRLFVIQEAESKRKQLEGQYHLLSAIPLVD